MASGRPSARIDINAASASLPKIAAYLVDWDRQDPTAQFADVDERREQLLAEQRVRPRRFANRSTAR